MVKPKTINYKPETINYKLSKMPDFTDRLYLFFFVFTPIEYLYFGTPPIGAV